MPICYVNGEWIEKTENEWNEFIKVYKQIDKKFNLETEAKAFCQTNYIDNSSLRNFKNNPVIVCEDNQFIIYRALCE